MRPLESAYKYSELGLSIIPCEPRGKKPLIQWKEYQKRIADEKEIDGWIHRYPNANIAIVTGAVSKLIVVDTDGPEGEKLAKAALPVPNVFAKTSKGFHRYYTPPEGHHIGNSVRCAKEIDIRSDGGYVIAPPSIHESGAQYSWLFRHGMDEHLAWSEMVVLDKKSLDCILSKKKSSMEILKERSIPTGERNDTLATMIGRWLHAGLDANEVSTLACDWNIRYCKPPLSIEELSTILHSISTRHDREANHV